MPIEESTIEMVLHKTTKNTDVYVPAPGQKAPPVSTLYVAKWYTGGVQKLTINLSHNED